MSKDADAAASHLAFQIRRSKIVQRVLIPKFYDPELAGALRAAEPQFLLPTLESLLVAGKGGSQLGVWLPREHYGTGDVPYVRTSDLFHWRIRPDYKKGASEEIARAFAARVDVKPGDILMVAHGTYLIGDVAMVCAEDTPLLLQDHVFRLRIAPSDDVSPELLLACLSTDFVRRQVRARQFSAEIIDKIGDRHLGIRVPIPRSAAVRRQVAQQVAEVLALHRTVNAVVERAISGGQRLKSHRMVANTGFKVRRSSLKGRVLLPRYYDPSLEEEIRGQEKGGGRWQSVGELVADGLLGIATGVEVGKLAYGTGRIPFLRTSDVVNWEVHRDPTQGVSQEIFDQHKVRASLRPLDVLLVRDGTYLVGSSALVLEEDLPALFCGGIFRIRVCQPNRLSPYSLLGLLNLPLVKRQLRAKQFTRDVIDTLGPRLSEVRIPGPDSRIAAELDEQISAIMRSKSSIKRLMSDAIAQVEPSGVPRRYDRPGWSMR